VEGSEGVKEAMAPDHASTGRSHVALPVVRASSSVRAMAADAGRGTCEDGTVVVGPYGVIEHVDAAACRLLGYAPDELVGQHGSMLVPRALQPSTAAAIDRMRRGDIAVSTGRLLTREGREIGVEVRSRRLPDGRLALVLRMSDTA